MMLRRLKIEHFRGIDSAEWAINRCLVGLVGAGDSTKTTLLDAIGLVGCVNPIWPHLLL
jgi:putative ATP-dependent endonuclease of the OLD family